MDSLGLTVSSGLGSGATYVHAASAVARNSAGTTLTVSVPCAWDAAICAFGKNIITEPAYSVIVTPSSNNLYPNIAYQIIPAAQQLTIKCTSGSIPEGLVFYAAFIKYR